MSDEADPWAGAGEKLGHKWRRVHLNLGDKAVLLASGAAHGIIETARGAETIAAYALTAQAWAAVASAHYAAANMRFRPDGTL